MYSVVLAHIGMYVLGLQTESYVLRYVSMALPGVSLFMMVSGFFTDPNKISLLKRSKFLIPFFLFGLVYTYFFAKCDIIDFITDLCKKGYWFLFEIFLFNCIVWVIVKTRIKIAIGFLIVECLSVAVYFGFMRHTLVANILGLYYWCTYMPLFFVGMYMKRVSMEKIFEKKNLTFCLSAIMIFLLLVIRYMADGSYWPTHIAELLMSIPVSVSIILFLYWAEKIAKRKSFYGKKLIKKMGSQLGQNTLEIYVLHYFIMYPLNGLKVFGKYMIENDCLWLELIISPFLALFICYICIFLAKLIEKGKLSIIFGR